MDNRYIVFVGCTGSHWFSLVIDNELRQVTHWDSGEPVGTAMVKLRCQFHLKLVIRFRRLHLRDVAGLDIEVERANDLLNYTHVDGNSDRQLNNFDCGVFALMNIERAVSGTLESPITQDLMNLYRSKILLRLLNQARRVGLEIEPRVLRPRQITAG